MNILTRIVDRLWIEIKRPMQRPMNALVEKYPTATLTIIVLLSTLIIAYGLSTLIVDIFYR